MVLPLKKVVIESVFYTDGDYTINPDKIDELGLEYSGGYIIGRVTYDKESPESLCHNPWYATRNYLQKLAVSFDVAYTHYYVLAGLYNMVNEVLTELRNSYHYYDGVYHLYSSYGGNYDGTEINITMERDMEDDSEKIDILSIKPRIIKALNNGGIFSISELRNLTAKELRSINDIGNGSLRSITQALREYGGDFKLEEYWDNLKKGAKH